MKDAKTGQYTPTQRGMELQLFEFTTRVVNDGTIRTSTKIFVTAKGQYFLINKFLGRPLKTKTEDAASNQIALPGFEVPELKELA
jgi:phage antirepressor YoqD-like protein